MKWKKFKIKTVTDAEDIIISTLYDIGLEGAQIEDKVPLVCACQIREQIIFLLLELLLISLQRRYSTHRHYLLEMY